MSAALSGKSESDTEASASLADDKRTPFTGKAAPPTSRRRRALPRKAPRYVSILSPLHSLFVCPNEEGAKGVPPQSKNWGGLAVLAGARSAPSPQFAYVSAIGLRATPSKRACFPSFRPI